MGPSLYFNRAIVLWSFASCTASSAAVGCFGSSGGARGSASNTRFFLSMPSAYRFGARHTSLISPSKNAIRFSRDGAVTATRFPFVEPNQDFTSRGKDAKSPSTIANKSIGSVGDRVSNIARTVDREVSGTAAHQPTSEGI